MPQDPAFYLLAIPAVLLVGLAKGGFSGMGALGMPLLALAMDPIQAAGILLPILIAQAMSAGSWRRWEAEEAALSSSSTVPYHNDPAKKQQPRTTGQQHPLPLKGAQNED